jgi:hypothetical protein
VGFSPRWPVVETRVAERRLGAGICRHVKCRSATPTRFVFVRGLKPTATLGCRSATKPRRLCAIRVRCRPTDCAPTGSNPLA